METTGEPASIRVLLADDHHLVRAGVRSLLEVRTDMEVVAEASDGHEALERARVARPDVALIDIKMPGMDGLDVTRRLTGPGYGVRVVILSMYGHDAYILGALQNGASGFVLKDAGPAELELAVRAAARGESFLCPSVSRQVIGAYLERREPDGRRGQPLTRRQREVLELVAEGRTTKEIARGLDLSIKTVEAHRAEIMRRLGVQNVAALVQEAVRAGLLAP